MSDLNNDNPEHSEYPDKPQRGKKSVQKKELVEEYRLIPVDDYDYSDEEYVDVIGILKDLWINRKSILTVAVAIFIFGVIIYAGSERMYYSEAKLMPETSSTSSQLGQVFQQYENILGIQRRMEDEDIRVSTYPYIVESLEFQIDLMQHEVYFSDIDQRVTIFEYFNDHYNQSFVQKASGFLYDFTFGLPRTLNNLISSVFTDSDAELPPIDFSQFRDFDEPKMVDGRVRSVASTLRNYITVTREPQTGFINIGMSLPDAHASTEVVIIAKKLLQEYVVDYRTERSLNNLEFIETQYEDAKTVLHARQDSLAAFQDRNVNPVRQSLVVTEQRLQMEYELAFVLYNTLARRLQEARIQVQEETPVFRVHEPATIPSRPSQPSATRILGGSVFVGLFLGIASLYLRRAFIKYRDEFRNKAPKPYLT